MAKGDWMDNWHGMRLSHETCHSCGADLNRAEKEYDDDGNAYCVGCLGDGIEYEDELY